MFSVSKRIRTAYHEAGHAVAALIRGGAVEELISTNTHGLAVMHASEDSKDFITFAGPWAEAHCLWLDAIQQAQVITTEGFWEDDSNEFEDYLTAVLYFGGGKKDRTELPEYEESWYDELLAVWADIEALAQQLLTRGE